MTAEGVDIDLYAEDLEQDVNSMQDDYSGEAMDLYDDAIVNPLERKHSVDPETGFPSLTPSNNLRNNCFDHKEGISSSRKYQAYIGNLTWWTTDQEIEDNLEGIGIQDFIEVKFFENRANGQSKGFCVVTVGSEASLRLIHEKMSKREIHGQLCIVTPPTKQALNQFESESKTRMVTQGNQGNMNITGARGYMGPGSLGPPPMSGMGMEISHRMGTVRGGPRGPPIGGPPPHRNVCPNPGPYGNYNTPPIRPQGILGPRQRPPPPHVMIMMQGPGPHGSLPPRGPLHDHMMDVRGPPPPDWNWNRPPPPHCQGPPFHHGHGGSPMAEPPQRGQHVPMQMTGGPPRYEPSPMNPVFVRPPVPNGSTMNDAEFDEVMKRNRTVSSAAIARAISDAAAGEFASAIETLVMAVSLIKQSRVSGDDRCQIIISSLNDTLHGIESKSYGHRGRSRSHERDRHHRSRRERSFTRDRNGYRDRSSERYHSRDRSRSPRDRDYRDHEGRERSFDERDKYRERDRCRERTRPEGDRTRDRERERETSERAEVHRAGRS